MRQKHRTGGHDSPPLGPPPTFGIMPIIWDSLLTAALAQELDDRLRGQRVRAISFDYGARDVALFTRESTLLFRLHPQRGEILLDQPSEPPPEARPLPVRIRSVSSPPDERVLIFEMRRIRGARTATELVVELMTNQWNALLLEGPDRRIRHVLWSRESGGRHLQSGSVYQLPPLSTRLGLAEGELRDEWQDAFKGRTEDWKRILLSTFAFTSSLNAGHILGKSGDATEDLSGSYRRWLDLRNRAHRQPGVMEVGGRPQPYPLPLSGQPWEQADSLVAAIRMATERAGESTEVEMISLRVQKALEDALERTEKRLASIRRDLSSLPEPDILRHQGNLILSRIGEIPRGANKAEVPDFEGRTVTVELDPSLTPQDNAAACFDRAARAERAHGQLPDIIALAEAEARSLRELLERTKAGQASVEEIREALPKLGETPSAGASRAQAPSLPYLTFRSSGGLEIRVGRGARKNDDLTFHHSLPNDVWLHARHASGAHVVLRWSREEKPPARDLEEAAILAALHSRARGSGMVPVDWTRRKHVRKPRKAPAGTVILDRVKTLFVEPDPELPDRLRDSGH